MAGPVNAMARTWRIRALLPVVPVVLVAVTGCTSGKKSASTPVTVTASVASTSVVASSSATSGAASSTAPARPAPTLPRCDSALPPAAVDKAMGHVVTGKTAFVVNKPDPSIKQLARINCQYGLVPPRTGAAAPRTTTSPAPKTATAPATTAGGTSTVVAQVEVSVSLYSSAAAAAARITATDTQWRSYGAIGHAVKVGAHPATILLGYGRPLLVLASGVRTVAVSVKPGAVAAAKLDGALIGVARAALAGTGG